MSTHEHRNMFPQNN